VSSLRNVSEKLRNPPYTKARRNQSFELVLNSMLCNLIDKICDNIDELTVFGTTDSNQLSYYEFKNRLKAYTLNQVVNNLLFEGFASEQTEAYNDFEKLVDEVIDWKFLDSE
jgi:hypothetical protein